MIGSRSLVGVLALLLTVVSASAFQETAPAPSASSTISETDESALGLADEDDAVADSNSIIGGVPNMNFGLELLYGGKSSTTAAPDEDDVGLKGRLKHTF